MTTDRQREALGAAPEVESTGLTTDPGIDKAQTLAATKLTTDESTTFHGPARAGGRRPA